ncbi:MAG: ATP-binding cassette domain-containing protein [Clostridia bacterium]|nr:ATP-binding cassette domain-containing protein [Clostridia bacterium]
MLKLIDIKKDYEMNNSLVHALKGVSVSFRKKEFAAILGPSGCGKTTMLNIIGGLDRYTSGDLIINGISTKAFTDEYWDAYRNSEIGFVFQSYNLIPHLTVLKNVELALNLSGYNHNECSEKALEALKKVHMEEHIHKKPHQLSGGQMQRVSIARALVNDPSIILADEPTGALDSELGEQVMQVLKEVSEEKLVIMVTHNEDLAERYSTRIINVKDGLIINDSAPFEGENEEETPSDKKREKLPRLKKNPNAPFKYTKMKWITAMNLSWKNLISKLRRTMLTTIAGSIGIIGMGLVLALSNGINVWMDNMKTTMLASVPIGVYEYSMDYDVMTQLFETFSKGSGVSGTFPDGTEARLVEEASGKSTVDQMLNTMADSLKFNEVTPEFVEYLHALPSSTYLSLHEYYGTRMNIIAYNKFLDYYDDVSPSPYKSTNISTMAGNVLGNSSLETTGWNQLIGSGYMEKYYDVLYGKYPTDKSEIVLVVNESNEVSYRFLNQFGYYDEAYGGVEKTDEKGNSYTALDFSKIVGYTLKLIPNDDYFVNATDEDTEYSLPDDTALEDLYLNKGMALTVVGILRVKPTAPMPALQCNFCYTPELAKYVTELASQSKIAAAQKRLLAANSAKNVFSETMAKNVNPQGKGLAAILSLLTTGKDLSAFNKYVGAETTPVYFNIYARNFTCKQEITQYLDKWNSEHDGKVKYFDVTEMFIYNLETITNLATLALVAVAAISLLVSSIMIAIITSNSVTERTREIGILRSIGARATDILNVFIAETVIIGALSGLLGIALTYALAPALSAIVKAFSSIGGLAVVSPVATGSLLGLSIVLAVISGFIPSLLAAKKNVVDALKAD